MISCKPKHISWLHMSLLNLQVLLFSKRSSSNKQMPRWNLKIIVMKTLINHPLSLYWIVMKQKKCVIVNLYLHGFKVMHKGHKTRESKHINIIRSAKLWDIVKISSSRQKTFTMTSCVLRFHALFAFSLQTVLLLESWVIRTRNIAVPNPWAHA